MAVPYTIVKFDKERKLRIDYKGLAELRSLADLKLTDFANINDDFELDPETVAKILWIAMRASEPHMTLDEAYEIIGHLGDNLMEVYRRSIEVMGEVLRDSLGIKGEESKNVETPTES